MPIAHNQIKGGYVKTTYLYARWLTWDRLAPVLKLAKNVAANEDGLRVVQYQAKVKTTSPYRVFTTDLTMDDDGLITAIDKPFGSVHSGLQLYLYLNHNLFEKAPKTYRDENGLMWEITEPNGWTLTKPMRKGK